MTLTSGARLGHYTILAPLGAGGMGEVWVAEDTRLKRKVALKVLPAAMAADPDRLARFQREAEAVAALTHPNIVTIYSVEEDADVRFMTMELIEGQSLDRVIPPGGLPLVQVLDIGVALADALAASHEVGIVHRDLKPGNVMLAGRERRVKVLDFGLAKLREGPALDEETRTTPITGEGKILGTVAYMSPEQAEGKRVDARSDLFSLGVVLYELSTGERPFKGDTSLSVLSAILKDTPKSVTWLRADLPREFGRIVKRCLQKDPEERYQTAKDVRADLKALRAEVDSGELESAEAPVGAAGAGAPSASERASGELRAARRDSGTGMGEAVRPDLETSRRRSVRLAVGLGLLVLVAMAGVTAVWWFGRPPATPPARPFESISLRRLATQGNVVVAAISPDGRYVAYATSATGQQTLTVRQVATAIDRVVVAPGPYWYGGVTFSKDGSYLYFVRGDAGDETEIGRLYQVSVLGGDPRKILDDVDSPITLSPDGARLAFIRGDAARTENGLMTARIDGSDVKKLAARPYPYTYDRAGPAWSPDGKHIVAGAGSSGDVGTGILVEVDAEQGTEKRVGSGSWGAVSQIAWFPDGSGLLMAAADAATDWFFQLWFVSYPSGEPQKISADPNNYLGMSVSLDGRSALTLQSDWLSTVWTAPKDDPRRATALTDGKGDGLGGLAWAGDDTIVFGTRDWGIWSVGADGRNRKLLTVGENNNRQPCLARDGRTVFFESWRTPEGIWRMDIDGGNVRLVVKEPTFWGLECTADGQWLLFQAVPSEIRRVRPDGTAATPLTANMSWDLAVSPDSTRIASLSPDPTGRFAINVIPFQGGAPVRTYDVPRGAAGDDPSMHWTPDGRALSYVVTRHGTSNVWIQPVAGGAPRQLTNFADGLIWEHSWSADGRLALARGRFDQNIVLVTSEGRK
jgi:eukaryotic-like serine/threonine-protein kinase